ncbi:hypothetical protein KDD17_03160 [Sulfitobacter albidus]|uniref:Uncharacterized protein n=1 Tax=Sulfitobacter albidus TaxID=2829501 RepID=A0A975JGM2_9RHOB|nr:hypothetical protein [Sulfitobacter albidus]QUJ78098.1 hypothetical protein KDD17_03160 [Sulfitobacter albidus]
MFDNTQKLEISPQEIDLIEKALETQSKILHMQASAGGSGAVDRLNEVKRVLATITAQRRADETNEGTSFSGFMRFMGQTT